MSVQTSGTMQMQLRSRRHRLWRLDASRGTAQSLSRCDREPRITAASAENQKPSVLPQLVATGGKRAAA